MFYLLNPMKTPQSLDVFFVADDTRLLMILAICMPVERVLMEDLPHRNALCQVNSPTLMDVQVNGSLWIINRHGEC